MRGGKENKVSGSGAPPSDLLVCFPSRTHLALMPKPISSPKRPNVRPQAKGNQMSNHNPEISEPTSPKVTCAGQIKGRHTKKSKHWVEALGFKKEVMNFLTCLGNTHFGFRCFGSFPRQIDISSDEEDEEEEEKDRVFSKWYMVIQEENEKINDSIINIGDDEIFIPEIPPPNALLLMRCRSAPAKRRHGEEVEEKKEKKISLAMMMKYDKDFYNEDVPYAFSRSRSWKR